MSKTEKKTNQKNGQKTWLQKNLATLIIVAVLIVGLLIMFYPTIADYWNSFHQSRAIASYMEDVASMDADEYDRLIESARQYNRNISENGIKWILTDEERAQYNAELDFTQSGIMGYIQIDKINVMLPIYHGTSESVLQTSIGHIEGTSLPVGCASFNRKTGELDDPNECGHIVLSGHRGLPSAKLFSDLDKIVEGDTFTLTILDETFTYQVDQIRIVLPEDLSDLNLEKGKDYCTLVTCTPYGINTHRLLVRGHRVGNAQGDMKVVADALQIDRLYIAPFIGIPILLILLIILLISTGRRRNRERIARRALEDVKKPPEEEAPEEGEEAAKQEATAAEDANKEKSSKKKKQKKAKKDKTRTPEQEPKNNGMDRNTNEPEQSSTARDEQEPEESNTTQKENTDQKEGKE